MSRKNVIARRTFIQRAGIATVLGILAASASAKLTESEPQAMSKFSAALSERLQPRSRTVYTVQLWQQDSVFRVVV